MQPWRSLTADEQARESRKMELYAAMVSNLDDNIGRLLEYLAERGELENTLIVFMGTMVQRLQIYTTEVLS